MVNQELVSEYERLIKSHISRFTSTYKIRHQPTFELSNIMFDHGTQVGDISRGLKTYLGTSSGATATDMAGGMGAEVEFKFVDGQPVFDVKYSYSRSKGNHLEVTDLDYILLFVDDILRGNQYLNRPSEIMDLECLKCGQDLKGKERFNELSKYDAIITSCDTGDLHALVNSGGIPLLVSLSSSTSGAPVKFGKTIKEALEGGWILVGDEHTGQLTMAVPIEFYQNNIIPYMRPDLENLVQTPYKAEVSVSSYSIIHVKPQVYTKTVTVFIAPNIDDLTNENVHGMSQLFSECSYLYEGLKSHTQKFDKVKAASTFNETTFRKKGTFNLPIIDGPVDVELAIYDPNVTMEEIDGILSFYAKNNVKGLRITSPFSNHPYRGDQQISEKFQAIAKKAEEMGFVVPYTNDNYYFFNILVDTTKSPEQRLVDSLNSLCLGTRSVEVYNLRGEGLFMNIYGYSGQIQQMRGGFEKQDFPNFFLTKYQLGYWKLGDAKIPVYSSGFNKRWNILDGTLNKMSVLDLT